MRDIFAVVFTVCFFYHDGFCQRQPEIKYSEGDSITKEFKVIPDWDYPLRITPIDLGRKDKAYYPDQKDEWLRKMNKLLNRERQHLFVRNSQIDYPAMILTTPSELAAIEKKHSRPLEEKDVPDYSYLQKRNVAIEHYLSVDKYYATPYNFDKSLNQLLSINATKAFTDLSSKYSNHKDGKITIQFYNDVSSDPIAFYIGEIKDGIPDGYGFFGKPYLVDGKMPFHGMELRNLYFVRAGMWKNGVFINEKADLEHLETLLKDDKLRRSLGLPDNVQIKRELVFSDYLKDSFNPDLTDAHRARFRISWKYPTGLEGFIYTNFTFPDFDQNNVIIDVVEIDQVSKPRLLSLPTEPALSDNFSTNERLYDDYTLIHSTGWLLNRSHVCTYEVKTYSNGSEESTATDWRYDEEKQLQIFTRKTRDSNWETAGFYSIGREIPCDLFGNTKFYVGDYGAPGNIYYRNYDECLKAIVSQIKLLHPDPKDDNSISQLQEDSDSKFEQLKFRLASSPMFLPSQSDKLQGVWYNPRQERLIFFGSDGRGYSIIKNNRGFVNDSYRKSVEKFKLESSRIKTLTFDEFTETDKTIWYRLSVE